METTENTQIEAVSEGLLDKDYQAKRHKVLIRDIQQESLKETPPKLPHGNPKKRPRKSPKRKNRRNTTKP
jgi:ribosomal protein L25 (general stress protein Ctc)